MREIEIELYWNLRKIIFCGQNLNPKKQYFVDGGRRK
jgi:hypothetical protein